MPRSIAILAAASVLCSSCATVTTIRTLPPDARVYVDGRLLGETPVEFKDSSPFWAHRTLTLRKVGYKDETVTLRKDQMRVGPLIGAIILLVPIFWLFGYPDTVTYELAPQAE